MSQGIRDRPERHVTTLGKPAGAEAASQLSPCGGEEAKRVYTTSRQSLLGGHSPDSHDLVLSMGRRQQLQHVTGLSEG